MTTTPLALAFPRTQFHRDEVDTIADAARRDLGSANRVDELPNYFRLTLAEPVGGRRFIAAAVPLDDGREVQVVDHAPPKGGREANPAPWVLAAVAGGAGYRAADWLVGRVQEWVTKGGHLVEEVVVGRKANPIGQSRRGNPPEPRVASWYPALHEREDGIFYRGVPEGGEGAGFGALGEGLYLTWSKPLARFFAAGGPANLPGGTVYTYRIPAGLTLMDYKGAQMSEIKRGMGFEPWQYSDDPMYARVLTNEAGALGYEGVVSDNPAEGIVLFDPPPEVALVGEEAMNPEASHPLGHPPPGRHAFDSAENPQLGGDVFCADCGLQWEGGDPRVQVDCPSCPSPAGRACVRPSGHGAWDTHVPREKAALEAGVLGRCLGPRTPHGPSVRCERCKAGPGGPCVELPWDTEEDVMPETAMHLSRFRQARAQDAWGAPPGYTPGQQALLNPAGVPGSGTVCLSERGAIAPCAAKGSRPTGQILYRPRMPDGSRPRVYLDAATPYAQLGAAMARARQEALREAGAPEISWARPRTGRVARDALGGLRGAPTEVVHQDAHGDLIGQPAEYRLVPAGNLIPSHLPESFQKHPMYPPGVQERLYHSDQNERNKVLDHTASFRPEMVVNDSPEAVVGPPVIMDDGVVLGGNSRTMTQQRVYLHRPETAERLRQVLKDRAGGFGFSPGDVDRVEQPILVRVVEVDDRSPGHLRLLVRLYNEGFMQSMDLAAKTVAEAVKLDPQLLDEFAASFTRFTEEVMRSGELEPPTVTDFLVSPASKPLVLLLERRAFIRKQEASMYVRKDGLLTTEGRIYLLRAMLGTVVRDPLVLDGLSDTLRNALAAAVPYAHQAALSGGGWDLIAQLADAIELRYQMQVRDLRRPEFLWRQDDWIHGRPTDPVTLALLDVLTYQGGIRQLPLGFKRLAARAAHQDVKQGSLLGSAAAVDPVEAIRTAWNLAELEAARSRKRRRPPRVQP